MSKYIIDVGDAYTEYIYGKGDMLCLPVRINEFEDNWLNTNIPLTPYTEPDTEKVREEAYKRGREDAIDAISSKEQSIADKAYQSGLSDAWVMARNIDHMSDDDIKACFGCGFSGVFEKYTASEAIDRITAYEQEEEKLITAEEVMRQYLDTFCKERYCTGCPLYTPDFTCGRGKHFLHDCVSDEEVRRAYVAVIQKMKEES